MDRGGTRKNGKLLFRLVEGQQGIMIALKRKGEDKVYRIPIYELLEPYISDIEDLKKCTKVTKYEKNLQLKIT